MGLIDSPFDWIGQVPANWNIQRTKYIFRIIKKQVPYEGQQILSITQSGVKPKSVLKNEGQMAKSYDGYQIVNCGDFAMNSMDLLTGWVDQSDFNGLTSPDYRVFRAHDLSAICGRYFLYVFQLLYFRRIYYRFGQGVSNLGRWRLPTDVFLNFPLPVPPKLEQSVIANYLDAKTSEIDGLIEKLRREIELLERYRRELIAYTVTYGLDLDVPMRDSRIEWMPQIPSHWEVLQGKRVFTKLQRPVREGSETITCFRDGTVTLRRNRRSEGFTESLQEIGYQGVEPGDLVIHEMDAFAGAIGVSDSFGKSTPVYAVCAIKNSGDPHFYAYLLRQMAQSDFIISLAKGIRQRTVDFRFKTLASLLIAVPPSSEQRQIANFLNSRMLEIDSTISGINKQIVLLEQYRRQVVDYAVTGKIRVGEMV